jgi:4-hydroxyphenylpyruvate dioxygenase-like putative hemolysin
MRTETLDNNPAFSAMDNVFLRIGKSISWRKPRSSEDHLRAALERLALLSPHLLADLGFKRDAAASAPDTMVWRRGQLRVVVARPTRSAFASTS